MITGRIVVNLWTTAHSHHELLRNGPAIRWTRAGRNVADELSARNPEHVLVVDWGIYETINLISKGTLPLLLGNKFTAPNVPLDPEPVLRDVMGRSGKIFVTHVPEYEQTFGVNEALMKSAERVGYTEVPVATVCDEYGRAIFECFVS